MQTFTDQFPITRTSITGRFSSISQKLNSGILNRRSLLYSWQALKLLRETQMFIMHLNHLQTFHIQLWSIAMLLSRGSSRRFIISSSRPHETICKRKYKQLAILTQPIYRYYHSSSCGGRSGVVCYNINHKFVFDTKLLVVGVNEFILSLPFNATDYESAVLPRSTYVQYDALRLEVS